MKTIGLIGGMSWESTVPYYRQVNQTVKEHLGGLHSAKVVLVSVDFHEVELLQRAGDWDAAGALLADAARSLQAAGADFIVLCTNTMHKVAPAACSERAAAASSAPAASQSPARCNFSTSWKSTLTSTTLAECSPPRCSLTV